MFPKMRRIVTGHNEKGRSVVMIDGPPPHSVGREEGGLFEIWNTDGNPVDSTDPTDRVKPKVRLSPPAGGTKFRDFAMAPPPAGAGPRRRGATRLSQGCQKGCQGCQRLPTPAGACPRCRLCGAVALWL